jgi:hypothetical protein
MKTILTKSILGGIIGSIIMSIELFVASKMGMPKMSPPHMLVDMMTIPLFVAWGIHILIGIFFALTYSYIFAPKVKIKNIYLKGAVFGLAAFVIAQIAIALLETIFKPSQMENSIMMLMIGSIIGHVIFGVAVSKTVGNAFTAEKASE